MVCCRRPSLSDHMSDGPAPVMRLRRGGGQKQAWEGKGLGGTGVRGKREGGDMYSDGSNVRWGDVNTPRGKR